MAWRARKALLAAAISVNAGVTKTRSGGDFVSAGAVEENDSICLTTTFARAAGSASLVKVDIEYSYDGGTSWAMLRTTLTDELIQIATNTAVVTGTTVAVSKQLDVRGMSHLRVRSVENEDGSNNITAFQVYMSY